MPWRRFSCPVLTPTTPTTLLSGLTCATQSGNYRSRFEVAAASEGAETSAFSRQLKRDPVDPASRYRRFLRDCTRIQPFSPRKFGNLKLTRCLRHVPSLVARSALFVNATPAAGLAVSLAGRPAAATTRRDVRNNRRFVRAAPTQRHALITMKRPRQMTISGRSVTTHPTLTASRK